MCNNWLTEVFCYSKFWCWQHGYSPESDSESRHKKHKRDHRDGSRRTSGNEELEDGEVGEDGEIQ